MTEPKAPGPATVLPFPPVAGSTEAAHAELDAAIAAARVRLPKLRGFILVADGDDTDGNPQLQTAWYGEAKAVLWSIEVLRRQFGATLDSS